MYCMVSYMARPAVTTPPGELMYMYTGLLGCSLSRNRSWAVTRLLMWSVTGPWTHTIRSLSSLE
jgi:hypothetical protein